MGEWGVAPSSLTSALEAGELLSPCPTFSPREGIGVSTATRKETAVRRVFSFGQEMCP
jgi:hypothetical protein